jgi:hypothetical protein
MLVSLERQLLLERIPASARHVGLGRRHIARQEEITPGTKARCFDRQPPSNLVCNTRPSPEVCTRRLAREYAPVHFIEEPNPRHSFSELLRGLPGSLHPLCALCFAQHPLHCPVSKPFALQSAAVVCGSTQALRDE